MRFVFGVVCLCSIPLSSAQSHPPVQTPASAAQSRLEAAKRELPLLVALERGMMAVRPIPDSPAPHFDDPPAREDQRRSEALQQRFRAALSGGLI